MTRNINPQYWIGDTVYSNIYREAPRGIVYHVRVCGSPESLHYEYMVLFEDGEWRVESEITLQETKPIY